MLPSEDRWRATMPTDSEIAPDKSFDENLAAILRRRERRKARPARFNKEMTPPKSAQTDGESTGAPLRPEFASTPAATETEETETLGTAILKTMSPQATAATTRVGAPLAREDLDSPRRKQLRARWEAADDTTEHTRGADRGDHRPPLLDLVGKHLARSLSPRAADSEGAASPGSRSSGSPTTQVYGGRLRVVGSGGGSQVAAHMERLAQARAQSVNPGEEERTDRGRAEFWSRWNSGVAQAEEEYRLGRPESNRQPAGSSRAASEALAASGLRGMTPGQDAMGLRSWSGVGGSADLDPEPGDWRYGQLYWHAGLRSYNRGGWEASPGARQLSATRRAAEEARERARVGKSSENGDEDVDEVLEDLGIARRRPLVLGPVSSEARAESPTRRAAVERQQQAEEEHQESKKDSLSTSQNWNHMPFDTLVERIRSRGVPLSAAKRLARRMQGEQHTKQPTRSVPAKKPVSSSTFRQIPEPLKGLLGGLGSDHKRSSPQNPFDAIPDHHSDPWLAPDDAEDFEAVDDRKPLDLEDKDLEDKDFEGKDFKSRNDLEGKDFKSRNDFEGKGFKSVTASKDYETKGFKSITASKPSSSNHSERSSTPPRPIPGKDKDSSSSSPTDAVDLHRSVYVAVEGATVEYLAPASSAPCKVRLFLKPNLRDLVWVGRPQKAEEGQGAPMWCISLGKVTGVRGLGDKQDDRDVLAASTSSLLSASLSAAAKSRTQEAARVSLEKLLGHPVPSAPSVDLSPPKPQAPPRPGRRLAIDSPDFALPIVFRFTDPNQRDQWCSLLLRLATIFQTK